MLTKDQREHLPALLARSTNGPWRLSSRDPERGIIWVSGSNEHGDFVFPYLACTLNWPENSDANAELMALAPSLAMEVMECHEAKELMAGTKALLRAQLAEEENTADAMALELEQLRARVAALEAELAEAVGPHAWGPPITLEEALAKFPHGTRVAYRPVNGEARTIETETREQPWTLGHGQVVVRLAGAAGGVLVEALEVLP